MLQYYAFAKFIEKLKWASKQQVHNLTEAGFIFTKLDGARLKFESDILEKIAPLSDDKQVRYLDSLMNEFTPNREFYIDTPYWVRANSNVSKLMIFELNLLDDIERICGVKRNLVYSLSSEKQYELIEQVREYYKNYDYLYWLLKKHIIADDGSLGELQEYEKIKLLRTIVSNAFETAYENIRYYYGEIEGEKKAIKKMLNWREARMEMARYNELQRIENGMEPDDRLLHIKILDSLMDGNFENMEINNLDELDGKKKEVKGSLLRWQKTRGGVADMAELLYRLERGGFLNLKEYMSEGNLSELCRRICYVFQFDGKDPIGNLKAYLSKLEGSFGPGPVQLEDLKPIGRSKGGMMGGVMPPED